MRDTPRCRRVLYGGQSIFHLCAQSAMLSVFIRVDLEGSTSSPAVASTAIYCFSFCTYCTCKSLRIEHLRYALNVKLKRPYSDITPWDGPAQGCNGQFNLPTTGAIRAGSAHPPNIHLSEEGETIYIAVGPRMFIDPNAEH